MKKTKVVFTIGLAGGLILSGCSTTTYVGNAKFDYNEICSKEYSSFFGRKTNGGCLPPTRAANAQRYYFDRFRLPVSIEELAAIDQLKEDNLSYQLTSIPPKKSNPIPSIIGQVFVTEKDQSKERAWTPPEHGNLFFLYSNPTTRKELPVELFVTTAVESTEQKELKVGTKLDASQLLSTTLDQITLTNLRAKSPELYVRLLEATAEFGAAKSVIDTGLGNYHYLGLATDVMDQLTTALETCDWIQRVGAGHHDQDVFLTDESRYPVKKAELKNSTIPKKCISKLDQGSRFLDDNSVVRTLISGIEEKYEKTPQIHHLGLITGVAIIRTKAASSVNCSQYAAGINPSTANVAACETLKKKLGEIVNDSTNAAISDVKLPDADTLSKLISANYASAAYKTLKMDNHGGVLAIHWLPLDIRKSN